MKLWLISQNENKDYDTYDSAVVAAETEAEAMNIHPGSRIPKHLYDWEVTDDYDVSTWASPENVQVKYIGTACPGTPVGVIVASFNAG